MDRSWGILAAAVLVLAASACGGAGESPAPPQPSPSSSKPSPSKPATTTPPTFTPAVSPAKVTAACPFLGADEFARITGTSKVVAQEQPPGKAESAPAYTCAYVTGDQAPDLASKLYFFAFAKADPGKPVTSTAANCTGPSTPLPGAGDAAMHCELDDYWTTLAIAKRVHGQTRMLNLHLPHYRDAVLAELAKVLGDRL
ncbi:hypothetical protein ABT256_30325 [Amycolatopsis japonica]|uniref:hypothetical protein n=1 Tax=Amycolatopsis japonica TaxID=208439 RepID=UPI003331CA1D